MCGARRTARHGWPAEILGSRNRDMPDATHSVSACGAADAGTYGIHRHAHGAGYTGVGLLHTVASRKRLEHRSLDAPVTGFLDDGAYDGASTRDLLRERYGETLDVGIPPPKNAVIRPQSARGPTVRDRHIAQIRSNGRMAWQAATGYNQRSRIETQIGRWKSVIGPKLKSRSFSRQITEIQVGQKVLNTMTALGRPVFERIA